MVDRSELLKNAVAFLSDPKTKEAPFIQRVQFLESKGLTSIEIDEAIRQASVAGQNTYANPTHAYSRSPMPSSDYIPSVYGLSQLHSSRTLDWRDYFIMAVVSGGIMSGTFTLARKYLFPHLQPPNQTQYDADVSELNDQFDAIELKLKDMQADCEATLRISETQQERVSSLADQVESNLATVKESERKTRDELREIREEVDVIRDMLPKMMEKSKEGSNSAMLDLQQELRSLKTLILSSSGKGGGSPISIVSPPTRPTIPAWQLAAMSSQASLNNESETNTQS